MKQSAIYDCFLIDLLKIENRAGNIASIHGVLILGRLKMRL